MAFFPFFFFAIALHGGLPGGLAMLPEALLSAAPRRPPAWELALRLVRRLGRMRGRRRKSDACLLVSLQAASTRDYAFCICFCSAHDELCIPQLVFIALKSSIPNP